MLSVFIHKTVAQYVWPSRQPSFVAEGETFGFDPTKGGVKNNHNCETKTCSDDNKYNFQQASPKSPQLRSKGSNTD